MSPATSVSRGVPLSDMNFLVEKQSLLDLYDERSVSQLGVGPPAWARIPSDQAPTAPPNIDLPPLLLLGNDPRCRCKNSPKLSAPVKEIDCTVYGLHFALQRRIQVQACSKCPPSSRQYAGPDLREYGVFNFNNTRLYRHELFDHFTNLLTAVETPFSAFRTIVERDYKVYKSPIPFVDNNAFRTAWYSFTRVQDLGVSFQCSQCGENPDVIILDGVTAGFSARHVNSSLKPPTTIYENSPDRPNVVAVRTAAVAGAIRRTAMSVVRWKLALRKGKTPVPKKRRANNNFSEDEAADDEVEGREGGGKDGKLVRERDERDAAKRLSIPKVAAQLKGVNAALSTIFESHLNVEWDDDNVQEHKPYARLLEQARLTIHSRSSGLTVSIRFWLMKACCSLHLRKRGRRCGCCPEARRAQLTFSCR